MSSVDNLPEDFCSKKVEYLNWESVKENASITINPIDCDNGNGFSAIPTSLKMWVDDDDYRSKINSVSVPNSGKFINTDPFNGTFLDGAKALETVSISISSSCYEQSQNKCDLLTYSRGFLHAPVPIIPYVVDTYVDTNKILDITMNMPDVVLPNEIVPNLKTPDIVIPDIILPDTKLDIAIPDIKIEGLEIALLPIEIPPITLPDITVDLVYPDVYIRNQTQGVSWDQIKKWISNGNRVSVNQCFTPKLHALDGDTEDDHVIYVDLTQNLTANILTAPTSVLNSLFYYNVEKCSGIVKITGAKGRFVPKNTSGKYCFLASTASDVLEWRTLTSWFNAPSSGRWVIGSENGTLKWYQLGEC